MSKLARNTQAISTTLDLKKADIKQGAYPRINAEQEELICRIVRQITGSSDFNQACCGH